MREHGKFLVAWLNRFEESKDQMSGIIPSISPRGFIRRLVTQRRLDAETFLHRLVAFYVTAEKDILDVPGGWSLGKAGTWEGVLDIIRDLHPNAKKAVRSGKLCLSSSDCLLDFDAIFKRGNNGRVAFNLVPANENSRAVLALASLVNSGDADRVRRCRNCRRFFFAWPRRDRQDCSDRCKVAFWQKTPAGRATRAGYMRQYRAEMKRRESLRMPKGYHRKHGRNLHVDLKKGA